MIYVMSDLHGQYNAFLEMLKTIKFNENDVLYILGDIIDRGPNPLEIYDYIKDKPNIRLLRGNHEQMMLNYYDETIKRYWHNPKEYDYELWIANGGQITEDAFNKRTKEEQKEILDFLFNTEFYKIVEVNDEKFILCHGRPNIYGDLPIQDEINYCISNKSIIWGRDMLKKRMNNGYRIIHGHTPVQYAFSTDVIVAYNYGEIINIDCGCAIPYSLGCLRLDDMKQFYVDNLEETAC